MIKKMLFIGEGTYAEGLAKGHKSYLEGFPQREKFLFDEFVKRGLRIEKLGHLSLRKKEDMRKERGRIHDIIKERQVDFDAIFVNNPWSYSLIPVWWDKPVVFDYIDFYVQMSQKEFPNDRIGNIILSSNLVMLCSRANKIVAQGGTTFSWLKRDGYEEKSLVIPNGYVSEKFFPYKEKRLSSIRKKYGRLFPQIKGKKIVCFTGKLGKWYDGNLDVAKAVCKLKDWVFVVAGDGPLMEEMKKFPKEKVVLMGRVDLKEVPDVQNLGDVFVLAVDDDSPIATTEAMACGKPILHYGECISWLVPHKESGYLVIGDTKRERIKGYQDGLKWCYENRKEVGERNLRRVRDLSWRKLSKKFMEFINK